MISTGNDIVALKTINIARTEQSNFYFKIIIPAEKALYDTLDKGCLPFANFIWLLWSVKESAYKYLQRLEPELVFSPSKIVINKLHTPVSELLPQFGATGLGANGFNNMPVYNGSLSYNRQTLYFNTLIYQELIITVVSNQSNFNDTYWGIKWISEATPASQSQAVRDFALKKLLDLFPADNLQLAKNEHGYPVILKDGAQFRIPVSFAHHDHYVAYSFRLLH